MGSSTKWVFFDRTPAINPWSTQVFYDLCLRFLIILLILRMIISKDMQDFPRTFSGFWNMVTSIMYTIGQLQIHFAFNIFLPTIFAISSQITFYVIKCSLMKKCLELPTLHSWHTPKRKPVTLLLLTMLPLPSSIGNLIKLVLSHSFQCGKMDEWLTWNISQINECPVNLMNAERIWRTTKRFIKIMISHTEIYVPTYMLAYPAFGFFVFFYFCLFCMRHFDDNMSNLFSGF